MLVVQFSHCYFYYLFYFIYYFKKLLWTKALAKYLNYTYTIIIH